MNYRVLCVGDVVGAPGVTYLEKKLPQLRRKANADFCIVNGENASMVGLTPQQARQMLDAGADVLTLGNHTWGRREICPFLDDEKRILRPANLAPQLPGRGWGTFPCGRGEITVVNLLGRCGMDFGPDNPFKVIETILPKCTAPIFLDFHAEATSEKIAMARMLDGRVAAVFGTHTHVPTADAQVLPRGTGYVTDLGMTGPKNGVLGVRTEQSLALFRGELTSRFAPEDGPCMLHAVLFTVEDGVCTSAERMDEYD